jgi:hypothetical protein
MASQKVKDFRDNILKKCESTKCLLVLGKCKSWGATTMSRKTLPEKGWKFVFMGETPYLLLDCSYTKLGVHFTYHTRIEPLNIKDITDEKYKGIAIELHERAPTRSDLSKLKNLSEKLDVNISVFYNGPVHREIKGDGWEIIEFEQ